MKKFFVVLLMLCVLLVCAACGKDEVTKPTEQDTAPTFATTDPTNSTDPPADEPHVHHYESAVTKESTCTADGEMSYSCTCGDSYVDAISAVGHNWGEFELESKALVGRPGKEKRTCATCLCEEYIEITKDAGLNSFYDHGLHFIFGSNYGTVSGFSVLEYATIALPEYLDQVIPMNTVIDALELRFDLTDDMKDGMKYLAASRFGYDESSDTIVLHYYGDINNTVDALLGYVHKGDNRYDTYYAFTAMEFNVTLFFKVELEYNLLEGKPNKYLSIVWVDAVPEDMMID